MAQVRRADSPGRVRSEWQSTYTVGGILRLELLRLNSFQFIIVDSGEFRNIVVAQATLVAMLVLSTEILPGVTKICSMHSGRFQNILYDDMFPVETQKCHFSQKHKKCTFWADALFGLFSNYFAT
jgi:hypothetical protein